MGVSLNEQTGYPSQDKPWLRYYGKEAIEMRPFLGTLFQNIYQNNKDHLKEVALFYFGKKISYEQLFYQVDQAAKAFTALGVKKSDSVAICMPAMPETIYAILALNKLGASANLLNPLFSKKDMHDRIDETNAKILVVANEVYGQIKEAVLSTCVETLISCSSLNSLGFLVKKIKKVTSIPNTTAWNEFINLGKDCVYEEALYEADTPALTVYSSGTTGALKGILLTNDSINSTICEGGQIGFEWERQDKYMALVPIWFSTGICASILVPLRHGISVILEPLYDFEVFYQHIKRFKPNFIISAVSFYEYLVNNRYYCSAYRHFKYVVAGGEYITASKEERYSKWLADNGAKQKMHKGYGMSECGGTVTASSIYHNVLGSAGIPTPHVTVAAFDLETGKELSYGERGEIRVLTPSHMLGYYKKPEATAKYLTKDKDDNVWSNTGDMGYVTEDGCLFVSGRLSDSYVNDQGKKIYLFDIERTILDMEQVKMCKAVVSNVNGQKTHVCHVSVDETAISDMAKKISSHCKKHLDEECQPRFYKFYTDGLPVSLCGKLDVKKMQDDVSDIVYA